MIVKKVRIKQFAIPHLSRAWVEITSAYYVGENNALKTSSANSTLVLTTQNAGVDGAMANASTLVVSRDNNLYVVGDISREVECLETPETNNYQM